MKIAVTGHRPDKLNHEWDGTGVLSERIYDELAAIVHRNLGKPRLTLITGMALGVDQIFAWVGLDLKVPIIAAIPCENQVRKCTTTY